MANSHKNWIPLVNYSTKYGVSLSTLRRRIKNEAIQYKTENGKYLILDEQPHAADSYDGAHNTYTQEQVSAQPMPATGPARTATMPESGSISTPVSSQSNSGSPQIQESILTTANRLIGELKSAYSKILSQQEEQIGLLKEEIADLRTLVKVLEEQLLNASQPTLQKHMGDAREYMSAQVEDINQSAAWTNMEDPLKMHNALESKREQSPPWSERINHAVTQGHGVNLFSKSLSESESQDLVPKVQMPAQSASRAPLIGSSKEESLFDFDEDFKIERPGKLHSETGGGREIDLSDFQIPDNFRIDFEDFK